MRWRVLGPVEAVVRGEPLPITRPQHRAVLAYLLLNANVVVPSGQLAEALWGGAAPERARTQIQVCVSRLRHLIRTAGIGEKILSVAGGYRITVADEELDLIVFSALAAAAREHSEAGAAEQATVLLRRCLALWRGPALAGAAAAFVAPAAAHLHDKRLAAYEDLFDAEFALGRHAAAEAPLRELVAENPWRERLAAQLMTALARAGHQAAALRVYEQVRRRLAEELGVEPGAQLAETHLMVLRQQLPPGRSTPAVAAAELTGPAQLPANISSFAGRENTMSTLDAMRARAGESSATAVIAIVGTAGVGKTALAVRWAHRVRHLFDGGQLFLDLGGYSPAAPMAPAEALSRCLRALGVPHSQVPDDIDEAASLFRSVLADKRVLILLDNARDTAQIKHLLPGGAGSLVIVTSRGRLDGLATRHDAQRLSLDVLTQDEAAELLTRVLGAERVAGQHEAVVELGQACARLPLALRIAAADLHNHPHQTISGYLGRLRDGDPLHILAVGEDDELAVRCAFAVSYQALPAGLQRLFRLFGVVPGCEVTPASAAVMLQCAPTDAARMLSGLASAHLVHERAQDHFATHDLLTLYSADLAKTEDNSKLLSWYLLSAHAAADRLYPQILRLPQEASVASVTPEQFATHVDALTWLDAHRHNLVTVIRHAAHLGLHSYTWSLADALRGYFWLGMRVIEWSEVAKIGLAAAQAGQHHRAEASARLSLGNLYWRLERFPDAIDSYQLAYVAARRADWPEGQGSALGNLGPVYRMSGRPLEALRTIEEALALNQRSGWTGGVAVNYNNLGLICLDLGRLSDAAKHHHTALALARQGKAVASEALALANLGQACHLRGQSEQAFVLLTDALRLHEQVGSRGRATAQCALALIHAERGNRLQATRLAEQALDMAREPAEPRLEAIALHTLGIINGDTRILLQALTRARKAEDRYLETDIIISLAEIDQRAVLSWCHAAILIAQQCGYQLLEGRALTIRAEAEYHAGDITTARRSAQLASRQHNRTGHKPGAERTEKLLTRHGG